MPSKTASPVVLVKSSTRMRSFSVKARAGRWKKKNAAPAAKSRTQAMAIQERLLAAVQAGSVMVVVDDARAGATAVAGPEVRGCCEETATAE